MELGAKWQVEFLFAKPHGDISGSIVPTGNTTRLR
jgi:hypothetical protein